MNFYYITLDYMREMSSGDKETEQELLKLLFSDLEKEVPNLTQLIANKDKIGVKRVSHHLKSTFAFTGNKVLTENIKAIEAAAQAGNINGQLVARWQDILNILPMVINELKLLEFELKQ
ncbi:MAG: Hpt domain-containing protein [Chitinophagales bacterium]|nr:Hpt domain-containing protein [Chitinophagales bacterium]